MCGVAGFTKLNFSPEPERIRKAVHSIVHRGPDQQGVFESEAIALGAARLKIIDLDTGDQPIFSESGDTVIAFNGEIYNHAELRADLEKRGHRFRTRTDTETVLAAFLEWDTACFSKLRGMFAIALWTESRRRLVLARDRVGIKPLYIARYGADLFFGSELKTIFVHPEFDRRLSLAGLDCYLSLNYVPAPWTLVEGVEKLRPGHWLEWQAGAVREEAYWSLPQGQPRERAPGAAEEELDALLRQSLREHLLSDVPLGVWLSGGIDSSTVLHYAATASSNRLRTFSISFRGRSFDETPYIRAAATQYATDHEEFDVNPEVGLTDAIEEFAHYFDEPNADAGALPVWYLSKMTRQNVTVALSGEGADELFGGYLTYRANRYARRMRRLPGALLSLAIGAARRWPVSDDKISFEYMLKRFLEGCRIAPERAHVYWNGTFSDAEKRALTGAPNPDALAAILEELSAAGEDLGAYLWWDQRYYLPDDILMKVDRMSMAHSIEVRPPFLDHRIVEFAATLPTDLKIRGRRQKVILKNLMRDKLPREILRRKKTGFDIPAHHWLRGPLRELMRDTLTAGASEHASVFQPAAIEDCMRRHLERRANLGYHLWGLMILFLWMKRWRIQTSGCRTCRSGAGLESCPTY
ncbi:MAG TPA: asparagine synthase (glutamine-hydrolyzing) [Bryobacteraceae bacterium]|nr:asparagine synthase (glutamine-hydrolyzing) [Bryobacteraceae bacterium]